MFADMEALGQEDDAAGWWMEVKNDIMLAFMMHAHEFCNIDESVLGARSLQPRSVPSDSSG